jgi:Ser/Thr protein kinase RdoA (MazF antagonist)
MNEPQGLWGQETKHFHLLTPEHVLDASEIFGVRLTGRALPLNSLENRVYDVELAKEYDAEPGFSKTNIILKFYRPGRWSKDQILEEHLFLSTLMEFEVPVVAPLEIKDTTVHVHEETNLFFTIFPKVMGRMKDEFKKDELEQAGRLIGRIHNVGSMGSFSHRLKLHPSTFIDASRHSLMSAPLEHLSYRYYCDLLEHLGKLLTPMFANLTTQRLHGDFHRGNIVWTSAGPMAVDFDDCLTGPVEQDLWLLLPGNDSYSEEDRDHFIKAYLEMTRKDHLRLQNLTEPLRAMRMVHFNAWISKRWDDHSFQRIFPQFPTANYWDQQLIDLRMQMGLIQERFGMGLE